MLTAAPGGQNGLTAYESNGMVYYLDPSSSQSNTVAPEDSGGYTVPGPGGYYYGQGSQPMPYYAQP